MHKQSILQTIWLLFLACAALVIIRSRVFQSGRSDLRFPMPSAGAEAAIGNIVSVSLTVKPETATPAAPTREPTPTPAPTPFAVFWMSDTQYYSYAVPGVFLSMTGWMSAQVDAYNACVAVHTGDIVDNHNFEKHWKNAEKAIRILPENLPFLCVAGNHDVGATSVDYTEYLTYGFCDVTARDQLYEGGVCWVHPFRAGGTDFLILGVGWQESQEYIAWAHEQLAKYEQSTVILLVHDFLSDDGSLTGNGKLLERELISRHANIRLVLCGHNDGSSRWSKTYADTDRTVNALMYNFQDDKKNGLGYMRILTFIPMTHAVGVTTYSPYLDDYSYFSNEGGDMFVLYNAY